MTKSIKLSSISLLVTISLCATLSLSTFAALLQPTPFKGGGNGQITTFVVTGTSAEVTATGNGASTHLGRFVRSEELHLDFPTGTVSGSIVFTAANGDQLSCWVSGGFTGPNIIEGTYSITGGTGRFAGASGSAVFSAVQSDEVNFSFAFDGSIDIQ